MKMIRRLLKTLQIAATAFRGDPVPDSEPLQLSGAELNVFANLPSPARDSVIAKVRAGADPAEAIAIAREIVETFAPVEKAAIGRAEPEPEAERHDTSRPASESPTRASAENMA